MSPEEAAQLRMAHAFGELVRRIIAREGPTDPVALIHRAADLVDGVLADVGTGPSLTEVVEDALLGAISLDDTHPAPACPGAP